MDSAGFSTFVSLDEHDAPDMFRRFTNEDLPFDSHKVEKRTHIQSRLIVQNGQTIQSISLRCLEKLFDTVRVERGDIGGFVLATCFPEDPKAMAEEIARDSGIRGEIYGIDMACSGFTAATAIAAECARITRQAFVVITSEILSAMINWEPPGMINNDQRARGKASKIFGDRTAGVIVKPPNTSHRYEILDAFAADVHDPGKALALVSVEQSQDIDGKTREKTTKCINMPGKGGANLLKLAPEVMVASIRESIQRAIDRGTLSAWEDSHHVVHHQANGTMVETMKKELESQGLGTEAKVWNCIQEMGNVSAASIPAAMAMMQDELEPGALIAMPAVGAGSPGFREGWLTRGCVLARVKEQT